MSIVLQTFLAALVASSMWVGAVAKPALAQTGGCALIPDEHNRSEKVLRCGDHLTVRSAPNTQYRLTGQQGDGAPGGAELDFGALMIEVKPSPGRRPFQILTPHAIAAVRGTTWAVEIDEDWTSVLVILGYVEVRRPNATSGVLLRATQGVDVTSGTGPLTARRWPKPRVDALLARFGK